MTTILFVCTGNLCRSPMAEKLLQARLADDPQRRDWIVKSAGTAAMDGQPASVGAGTAMASRDLDLGAHRAQQVNRSLIDRSDLILAMTPTHVEALRHAFPDAAERIALLSEMVGALYGIADPYGRPQEEYLVTANELSELIEQGYEQIVALAEKNAHHRCSP